MNGFMYLHGVDEVDAGSCQKTAKVFNNPFTILQEKYIKMVTNTYC